MNHFISFLIAFILCYGLSAQKIYITKNAYQADLKVFVVDKEYQADLRAYKVDQAYKAKGNSGLWYFTKNNYQSEKKNILCKIQVSSRFNRLFC